MQMGYDCSYVQSRCGKYAQLQEGTGEEGTGEEGTG